ncbi:hypothetical protein OUZ56_033440 [Daphnia magna]|uniref:Uncharacterized protein n=1 Tax=Daphnia magna TaxID=35525 RepID=A0ABQ9ZYH6_9CRUS|nr:hypothetical protein OUZ56_033440 [Daphnia magna]
MAVGTSSAPPRNGLELSPNVTLFHLYAMKSELGSSGFLGHKNLTASASSGCSAMLRKAFSISAIQAIRFIRKHIKTERRSGLRFGPVSRTSLRLGPYLDLAAPSKTVGQVDWRFSELVQHASQSYCCHLVVDFQSPSVSCPWYWRAISAVFKSRDFFAEGAELFVLLHSNAVV